MTYRLFEGGRVAAAVSPAHRGIAYGDGLFETMRVHDGGVPLLERHLARLFGGAERLGITLPERQRMEGEIEALVRDRPPGVLKLVLTRGGAGRGYAPDPDAPCLWQLSLHELPAAPPAQGLALRWCDTRLAIQPLLAGIKHCNRLEQVLARAEWRQPGARDADADEGLVCDAEGHVAGATAANLFVLCDGTWRTPPVDRCGVAGVCRGWVLEAMDASEERMEPADVESAEAVVLCNAVRGILPVARLGARHWDPHPAIADLRRRLADAHPAFDS